MYKVLYLLDEFWLDYFFQPIADWSHKRLGIHPQQIAEFFGMGGVFSVIVREAIRRTHINTWIVIAACLEVGWAILLFQLIIRKHFRHGGGRNPKRYMFANMRIIFLFFILIGIGLMPAMTKITMDVYVDLANSMMMWLGFGFASVDEPPPREYRRSVLGWAS